MKITKVVINESKGIWVKYDNEEWYLFLPSLNDLTFFHPDLFSLLTDKVIYNEEQ